MMLSFVNESKIKGRVYYPTRKSYIYNGIDKDFIDNSVCLKRIDRLLYFHRNKKLVKDIEGLYALDEYALLLAYSLFSNGYVAYSLYIKYKIPYCVIVQNTDVNFYFKRIPFLRFIGRQIIKHAKRVIFISKPYKNNVIENFLKESRKETSKKSMVIPFGIEDFWFKNKYKPKQLKINSLNLLFVGKVNANKNITTIIDVCKELIKRNINVTYTVVGAIEDHRFKKVIYDNNFINYIPFTNKEELLKIYRSNDIFIMTSLKESFGLVYGEAMTQGLPVIYTQEQGFDQHFKEGEIGYSVDPMNVEEIVHKVELISKRYNEISMNCLKLVDKFKWENISKKYKSVIENLVK